MDFSTMNKKVEEGRYEDLIIFRKDFELICNNCMLYNGPDTIYYKVKFIALELETQFWCRKVLYTAPVWDFQWFS